MSAMPSPSLGPVQSLGYVGLRAKAIEDWTGYGDETARPAGGRPQPRDLGAAHG